MENNILWYQNGWYVGDAIGGKKSGKGKYVDVTKNSTYAGEWQHDQK